MCVCVFVCLEHIYSKHGGKSLQVGNGRPPTVQRPSPPALKVAFVFVDCPGLKVTSLRLGETWVLYASCIHIG